MAVIKGENLRIFIGSDEQHLMCVAMARTCKMNIAVKLAESDSKLSDTEWFEREPVAIDWAVVTTALIATADTGAVSPADMEVGQQYIVRMSRTTGPQNRTAIFDAMQLTGRATLTDISIAANNGDEAVWNAKFVGDGELSQFHI